jgi:hypothetical protein
MPHLIGVFRQFDPIELSKALVVEKAKLNFRRGGRKQREINTKTGPRGAQRMGRAFT